jgi:DNA (cytosine-5)-methyltransferase 1
MNHGSLFSGIGGFDLAAEWMGWNNIFHCEWNDFGQRVLKHHFPNSISYGDITTTDFTIHRGQIDILTGGFPCQPYSQAGKRLGKEDDRHLWPEMLRAIREIQPRWVVGENVLGLVNWNGGLVFDEVQADLEYEGYVVQPYVLPACAVNAPHRRDRVWFVAHCDGNGHESRNGNREGRNCGESGGEGIGQRLFDKTKSIGASGNAANSKNVGCQDTQSEHGKRNDDGQWASGKHEKGRNDIWPASIGHGESGSTSDPNGIGLSCEGRPTRMGWERLGINNAQDNRGGWENFPTQSPICGGDDGLPTELDGITFSKWRQESVKAYGNAIVPQVAHQIFQAIQAYEEMA